MSTCKSCGAPIIWAKTQRGKSAPLDATPTAEGNMGLRDGIAGGVGEDYEGPRYTSHFATCPNADQHRRTR